MSDTTPKNLSVPEALDAVENAVTNSSAADLGRELVENTSWWKKNRTSVVNGFGALLNLLMLVTFLPAGWIDPAAATILAVTIQAILFVVGIFVPDAISERQRASLENYVSTTTVGKHRKED
jgi:hypothetical protein